MVFNTPPSSGELGRLVFGQTGAFRANDSHRVAGVLADLKLPLYVLILGMGNDSNTAFLFPDAPELPEAMDLESRNLILAMSSPS